MRSFLQRAQQEEDPNQWLPWLERVFNATPEHQELVWEEGLAKVPTWILCRHMLVFCYSMGIHEKAASWSSFLETVIQHRSDDIRGTLATIVPAWVKVIQDLKGAKVDSPP